MTMFDKGVIAIVPVDTSINPKYTGGYDIKTLRVGEVIGWYPEHVRVRLWNQKAGRHDELVIPKRIVAIAHQDCAWYKQRKFLGFKIDLRERQIGDLLRVAARLKEAFPNMTIETYYARLEGKDPERVVFERV